MNDISSLFPVLSPERRRQMLQIPQNKVKALIDSDTANEMDDQFAISLALLLPDKLDVQAITAAPFAHAGKTEPPEGMEKSYQEILGILNCLDRSPENFVFRGSTQYLPGPVTPVESEAARRIVALAEEAARNDEILYVLAIGAITNVASALLMKPEIIRNMTVVWLGGHDLYTRKNNEYNLIQDVMGARVLFDSGVPLIWVPCCGVAELLDTNLGRIVKNLEDCGRIGDFLTRLSCRYLNNDMYKQKVIWDISTVICLARPDLATFRMIPAPILNEDASWTEDDSRHEICKVTYLQQNGVFRFLYEILKTAPR